MVLENIVTPTETITSVKKEKPKRKTIPLALKRSVWNKYIGEEIGKTSCLCCKITDISQMNFSCGHIVSVYNGGDINLENLKPICVSCNSSMGTQNMDEFIQNYGL
jgi:5-methylcytosine-specific restriction endonuclease McrA